MKRAVAFTFLGLGLLILLLSVAARPEEQSLLDVKKQALTLRQIGHEYLAGVGDSTSIIPAVTWRTDGGMVLCLERDVDYDLLVETAQGVTQRLPEAVRNTYSLALVDCFTEELFLGALIGIADGDLGAACTGRDQEARCSNVVMRFTPAPVKDEAGFPWWTLGLLLMGYGGWLAVRPGPAPGSLSPDLAPAAAPTADTPRQLGPNATFAVTAQELTVAGTVTELTYREAQLLAYLSDHPNEVLKREDIHDAVWGAEGLIVGRSLDVFVSRLRKKLREATGVEIQTVHGLGYRFRLG